MRETIHPTGSALMLAIACFIAAPSAMADSVEIFGEGSGVPEGLGSFTGILDYQADPFANIGLLTIELTNTSDPEKCGYVTGFLFNIASSDDDAAATLLSDPPPTHPFEQYTGSGLDGWPYGNPFDAGAGLGGGFATGGDPTAGIAVGETGVFAFEIDAEDAGDLTAISFLEGGPFDFNFIVRFMAIDGDFDTVPASVVPLPAPVVMGGIGLAGVVFVSRRSRRIMKYTS